MMRAQAFALSKNKWSNHILDTMTNSRDALTIRYWSANSAVAPYPHTTTKDGQSFGRALSVPHTGSIDTDITTQSTLHSLSNTQATSEPTSKGPERHATGNYIRIKIASLSPPPPIHAPAYYFENNLDSKELNKIDSREQLQRRMASKVDLQTEWNSSSGLRESSWWSNDTTRYQNIDHAGLSITLSQLNIDNLLEQATTAHSQMIITELKNTILRSDLFNAEDVQFLHQVQEEGFSVPILRLWYRPGESAVDITIDSMSCRLSISIPPIESGSKAQGEINAEVLDMLASRLNKTPWRIPNLIVELRCMVALSDLDKLAEKVSGICPLNPPRSTHRKLSQPSSQSKSSSIKDNWLPITSSDATFLAQKVAGVPSNSQRLRFYMLEGVERSDDEMPPHISRLTAIPPKMKPTSTWYIMTSMVNTIRFWLVQLRNKKDDPLVCDIDQIYALSVDKLFTNTSLQTLQNEHSEIQQQSLSLVNIADSTTRAMLTGRSHIKIQHLEALVTMCQARLAFRQLQYQLSQLRIPYALRQTKLGPKWVEESIRSTYSAAEALAPQLDLNDHIPIVYIPVTNVMVASPLNWSLLNHGVLPLETKHMISLHIEINDGSRSSIEDSLVNPENLLAASSRSQFRITAILPIDVSYLPEIVHNKLTQSLACLPFHDASQRTRGYDQSRPRLPIINKVARIKYVYPSTRHIIKRFISDWSRLHMILHLSRQLLTVEHTPSLQPFKPYTTYFKLASPDTQPDPELTIRISNHSQLSIRAEVPYAPSSPKPNPTFLLKLTTEVDVKGEKREVSFSAPQSTKARTATASSPIVRWLHSLVYKLNQRANIVTVLSILKHQTPLIHVLHGLYNHMQPSLCLKHNIPPNSTPFASSQSLPFSDVPPMPIAIVSNLASTRVIVAGLHVITISMVAPEMFFIGDNSATRKIPSRSDADFAPYPRPIPKMAQLVQALSTQMQFSWNKSRVQATLKFLGCDTNYLIGRCGSSAPLRAPLIPLPPSGLVFHSIYLPTVLSYITRWIAKSTFALKGMDMQLQNIKRLSIGATGGHPPMLQDPNSLPRGIGGIVASYPSLAMLVRNAQETLQWKFAMVPKPASVQPGKGGNDMDVVQPSIRPTQPGNDFPTLIFPNPLGLNWDVDLSTTNPSDSTVYAPMIQILNGMLKSLVSDSHPMDQIASLCGQLFSLPVNVITDIISAIAVASSPGDQTHGVKWIPLMPSGYNRKGLGALPDVNLPVLLTSAKQGSAVVLLLQFIGKDSQTTTLPILYHYPSGTAAVWTKAFEETMRTQFASDNITLVSPTLITIPNELTSTLDIYTKILESGDIKLSSTETALIEVSKPTSDTSSPIRKTLEEIIAYLTKQPLDLQILSQ